MTIYYVDPTGSDSNTGTSEGSPFRQPQKGADVAVAGDTVYVKAGTYDPFETKRSGSAMGGYITFSAYPGHEQLAKIDGTGFSGGFTNCIRVYEHSYIKILNFEVTKPVKKGAIWVEGIGTNVTISGNYIHHCTSMAIAVVGIIFTDANIGNIRTDWIIENNDITQTNTPGGVNECISVGNGIENFIIRNNHIYDSLQYGIDIKDGAAFGQVYGNLIEDIEKHAIYLDTAGYAETDIDIYNNICIRCRTGITYTREQGGHPPLRRIRAFNNLIYDNNRFGVNIYLHTDDSLGGDISDLDFFHNTIFNNTEFGIRIDPDLQGIISDVRIKNNIVYNNGTDILNGISGSNIDISNNLTANPLFEDQAARDLRLTSGSPARDFGIPSFVEEDIEGKTRDFTVSPDVGAYEFQSSTPPPGSGSLFFANDAVLLKQGISKTVVLDSVLQNPGPPPPPPPAVIIAVAKNSIFNPNDANSYVFPSATYENNKLYLVFVYLAASPIAPQVNSISGAGLNFEKVGETGAFSGTSRRIEVWRALNTSGAGTGVVTISLNATSLHMLASMVEFSGVLTTGSNGADAIGQLASTTSGSGTVTQINVTFTAAFGSDSNRPVAAFTSRSTQVGSIEEGYTQLHTGTASPPSSRLVSGWNSFSTETIVSCSWPTLATSAGIAAEIVAGSIADSKTISIDSLLQKQVSKAINLDSSLLKLGLSSTVSLDTILFRVPNSLNIGLDSIVVAPTGNPVPTIKGVALDARLFKFDNTVSSSLDSLLLKQGLLYSANADAIFLKQDNALTFNIFASLLLPISTSTFSLDAILFLITQGQVTLDAVLSKKNVASTVVMDAIISDRTRWTRFPACPSPWTPI